MDDRPLEFWDLDEWRTIVTPWPQAAKDSIGGNLRILQHGDKPASHCKTLQDFPIPLLELWHRGGQRVICTTEYASLIGRVHVLDAFMKDAKDGAKMRPADKDRITGRAKALRNEMNALMKALKPSQRHH